MSRVKAASLSAVVPDCRTCCSHLESAWFLLPVTTKLFNNIIVWRSQDSPQSRNNPGVRKALMEVHDLPYYPGKFLHLEGLRFLDLISYLGLAQRLLPHSQAGPRPRS